MSAGDRLAARMDHAARHRPELKKAARREFAIGVAYVLGILHGALGVVVLANLIR